MGLFLPERLSTDTTAGRLRQEVERLRLARNFGGAVNSCLADRCYAESCLVDRCYARQISRSLRIWTDERRMVAPLGAVVASTDDWTGKDDADLFPEDGSVVRG
ncbi:Serine/threonine-protein kinase HT1 [Hordeum vulgare]|nr:Serine/threonine-protein kinase HT1 [Hordeum vulgare]